MAARHPIPPRAGRLHQADAAPPNSVYDDTSHALPARQRVPWTGGKTIVLITMLITFAVLLIWLRIVTPWWQDVQDQWHYGDSRITQLDANVGHGGVSHFVAQVEAGTIIVLELPLADPKQLRAYVFSGVLSHGTPPVVQLLVQDVNHDGRPDLIVRVAGTNIQLVLINTGRSFAPMETQP